MNEINHDVWINAAPARVFEAVSQPEGLDSWWTLRSSRHGSNGELYEFDFGDGCVWHATVCEFVAESMIGYQMTEAADDWIGTRIRFGLEPSGSGTTVGFSHSGWSERSPHFRQTSFCWALYLRLLRSYLESGRTVEYHLRYDD